MLNRRRFIKMTGSLLLTVTPIGSGMARTGYPQRIATPDRGGTQTLLALGMVPVVSVDASFYNAMGSTPSLPANIPDAGDPSEPNLELLRFYQVELIVTVTISPVVQEQLRRVAPVFALDIYRDYGDTWQQSCDETERLANVLGRASAAHHYIRQLAQKIALTRDRLAHIPLRKFILLGLSTDGRHITVYGRKSIMSAAMEQMGFSDAWRGETNNYGFTNCGIEALATYTDASLLVIDYGESMQAAIAALNQSPLWQAMPVVQQRQVFRIGRIEVFGGLPLADEFTDRFADALLRPVRL